jgi:gluconate 5-dehydrogenase
MGHWCLRIGLPSTAFSQAGATIVFNDLNQEKVDKGLASYKAEGIDAHGYVCNVTDEDDVKATVEKITKEVGVIDILVNNAGIIKRIPMLEMSAADFRAVIDSISTRRSSSARRCVPA